MSVRRWSLALLFFTACGPKPPVRTALQGDLASLKRDVASAQQSKKLTPSVAVQLARAVAEREVMSAQSTYGALRVRTLRPCASPLRSTIEKRANGDDDVAAELDLILLELHALDPAAAVHRYTRSESGGFRAVAARAAVRPIDADLRKRFFTDPDERVRRAAFAAAYEAREPGELLPVLESARLDPDAQSQSLAARAAGAIGGERAVLALKDLWPRADDALQIAIVDAWTEPASFSAGGARELSVVAQQSGVAALSASYALLRSGGAEAAPAGAQLRQAISNGSDDEKRLALNVTPLTSDNEPAFEEASQKASPELRVLALKRLSTLPARRAAALSALRGLAQPAGSSAAEDRVRSAALNALAQAGDASVSPALVQGLSNPDVGARAQAARGLVSLGEYGQAAPALADDDASLRTDVACEILARESAQR